MPDLKPKYSYSQEGKGSVSFYKFLSQSSLNYTDLSAYTAIPPKSTNWVWHCGPIPLKICRAAHVSKRKRVVQSHWPFVPTTFSFVFPGLKDTITIPSRLLDWVFTREGDGRATEELECGRRVAKGAL